MVVAMRTIQITVFALLGSALAGMATSVLAQVAPPPGSVAATAQPSSQPSPQPSPSPRVEFGYSGPTGPDHWAELSKSYAICSTGQQESPIDLRAAIGADLGAIGFAWKPLPLRATNNGHTVQFDAPPGSSISLEGNRYALAQFHIHHPSEHLLDGRRFPLEIHFVHTLADGRIGVIGVFVEEGKVNPALQTALDAIPKQIDATNADGMINPNALLPATRGFYRYEGSLTTPPCAEKVDWIVLRTPIQASAAQIAQFQAIFPFNARPLQAINRRFLLRSR